VLIAALLGGTQCLELCSFASLERQTKAAASPEQAMPCHHEHAPRDSQPSTDPPCAHQDLLIADKPLKDSSPEGLEVQCLSTLPMESAIAPILVSSRLPFENKHFLRIGPLIHTSVLRI